MMELFIPTLSQIAYLFLIIFIGYFVIKIKILPNQSDTILSKLESYIFIPALILSTFMTNFNIDKISIYGSYFFVGLLVSFIGIILALILGKFLFKGNILYTYGLAFSNFGFMGNAVVLALFPSVFTEYLIFVLPFWFFVYLWGVPELLRNDHATKIKVVDRMKSLINPMVISMFLGIIIGLIGIKIPSFLNNSISTLGSLMTPIAMLVTGMTIAKINLLIMIKKISIYLLSLIRLVLIPLLAIIIISLIDVPYNLAICVICALSMPLGLNSIIVLNAYGYDTSEASAMALISHALSILTIPMIITILNFVSTL